MAKESKHTTMTVHASGERAREFFNNLTEPVEASFQPSPGSRGTEVTLRATDGKIGYEDLRQILRRAKQRIETGEEATSAHRAATGVR